MNNGAAYSSPSVNVPFVDGAPPGGLAVICLRASSTRQVGRDYDLQGISIPVQRTACHRKADQLGLTIADE